VGKTVSTTLPLAGGPGPGLSERRPSVPRDSSERSAALAPVQAAAARRDRSGRTGVVEDGFARRGDAIHRFGRHALEEPAGDQALDPPLDQGRLHADLGRQHRGVLDPFVGRCSNGLFVDLLESSVAAERLRQSSAAAV
jgi:hypothetical protein